jgi:phospholipid transport system substrate-binding protein
VDYSVEQVGDAWKVYDITIEGVSLVTNYRGQFGTEIRQGGMDGLIQRIAEKNKSNAAAKK